MRNPSETQAMERGTGSSPTRTSTSVPRPGCCLDLLSAHLGKKGGSAGLDLLCPGREGQVAELRAWGWGCRGRLLLHRSPGLPQGTQRSPQSGLCSQGPTYLKRGVWTSATSVGAAGNGLHVCAEISHIIRPPLFSQNQLDLSAHQSSS